MILAFALALVGAVLMGALFLVGRSMRDGRTLRQAIGEVLAGLALILVLPVYGVLVLVSIAASAVWRAAVSAAHAARHAFHHSGPRHRTNP